MFRLNQFKDGRHIQDKIKNSLRSFTYIDLDLREFDTDKKKIKLLNELSKELSILKADKGLPKMHKHYENTPKFRPIIDTTGTPHYNVGKFLAELLNPLAHNEYTLRDSFHAVSDLKSIPNELFTQGYRLVSFDVVSLFTNVPLERTVQIILDRVFKQNLTSTTLSKRPPKKLILDSCTKTAFLFNDTIFEQRNGVSVGSALGPVLSSIILSEFEKLVVSYLIASGTIKFYRRYVDDTFVLIKPLPLFLVSNS